MKKIPVEIYSDFNFKNLIQHPFANTTFTLELSEDQKKGRVVNPYGGAFGSKKTSRLNKLIPIGSVTDFKMFELTVEGRKVFLKIYKKDLAD